MELFVGYVAVFCFWNLVSWFITQKKSGNTKRINIVNFKGIKIDGLLWFSFSVS